MAAHAHLKNEFMEDKKNHNLMPWLICILRIPYHGSLCFAGGGMLYINNAQQVIVEGTVQANGAAGTTSIGGGSGGTIRIFSKILEGSGSVQVVGGNGGSSTGGGGGGRLQIKYDDVLYWFGDFQAEGGTGYSAGGAGTVYLEVVLNFSKKMYSKNCKKRGNNQNQCCNYP